MSTRNQALQWIGSLLIILTVVFSSPNPAIAQDLRVSRPGPEFLIVGHMGAPIHEVENTLQSFQKALELGANAIETDVCITKDGELFSGMTGAPMPRWP
jgi:glycerophosphoryl diester phosphodiesterase